MVEAILNNSDRPLHNTLMDQIKAIMDAPLSSMLDRVI